MGVKPRYIDPVCRPFCSFFREAEKEAEACGGVIFLDQIHSPEWCTNLGGRITVSQTAGRGYDRLLGKLLCTSCPFAAEDCDFRAGKESPPCGGYVLLAIALEEARIGEEDLQ